jgi:hypothetical protein
MPYNLLLLPLIGGFLFVHLTHFFRFGAQRLDGYRLLFQSAIAGICLSAAARLIDLLIDPYAPGRSGPPSLDLVLGRSAIPRSALWLYCWGRFSPCW